MFHLQYSFISFVLLILVNCLFSNEVLTTEKKENEYLGDRKAMINRTLSLSQNYVQDFYS